MSQTKGSLTDLQLAREQEADLAAIQADQVPEEMGARRTYQPGHYVLQLPMDLSRIYVKNAVTIYDETVQVQKGEKRPPKLGPDNKPLTKDRITAVFDDQDILTIIQSPYGQYNGDPLHCRISGVERKRGKDGPQLSALQYLLRALGETVLPASADFEKLGAALKKYAGKKFEADWEWTGRCNPERQAYFVNEADGTLYPGVDPQTQAEIPGCGGDAIYQSKWPTKREEVEGLMRVVYLDRAICSKCSAVINPFGELVRFKAVA